jgi:ketosteroid isomerase-like protein
MKPKQVVNRWVERFNLGDASGLAELYHDDAVNHQVTQEPVEGREAIKAMFEREFYLRRWSAYLKKFMKQGKSLHWSGAIRQACEVVGSLRFEMASSHFNAVTGTNSRSSRCTACQSSSDSSFPSIADLGSSRSDKLDELEADLRGRSMV